MATRFYHRVATVVPHWISTTGARMSNVWYVRNDLTFWTGSTLERLCEETADWWVEFLQASVTQDWQLISITATGRDVPPESQFVWSPTDPIAGTNTGSTHAANAALCISFKTGFTGRHYNGRTYLGGYPESAIENNRFLAPAVTAALTAFDEFGAMCARNQWAHVLATTIPDETEPLLYKEFQIESYVSTSPVVTTQKRRLPRRT